MSAAAGDPWLARARGRWRALWTGDVAPEALSVVDDPAARARLDDADRAGIQAMLARREAAGQTILRGPDGTLPPLYRLAGQRAGADALELHLGRTDYGEYLWTNVEDPARRERCGDACMSDALAVCATLVTADARLVVGRRPPRIAVAGRAARHHVLPSGHPEPPADPVTGLFLELEEEAGIAQSELRRVRLTGLVRALPSGKPELTFALTTALDADAVLARRAAGVADAWEFEELQFVPWSKRGASDWLEAHRDDAAPPGLAAVALAARAAFGGVP